MHAENNGTVTNSLGGWTPLHRVWLKGSNITVIASGLVNADYLGYPPGAGPGAGTDKCGAGHAGVGRRGFGGGSTVPAYGDSAEPWQPGSGGGVHQNSGPGGGSIRIEAHGQLELAGQLRARGKDGAYSNGAGASGGSIWLTCRTFVGASSARVTVDGGSGDTQGAAGSAGRIALYYDSLAQAALVEPHPPVQFTGKGGSRAGGNSSELLPAAMATLYLPDTLFLTESLTGKRFQYTRLVIPGFTTWSPPLLTIDDCVLGLPDGLTLDVAGDLTLTQNAELHLFAAPVADVLNDAGASVWVGGNLVLTDNAWIYPYADHTNGATVMIEVDGNASTLAGQGGGAIRLTVAGNAAMNGTLTAVGAEGLSNHGPGGSGGGIELICQTLIGNGLLQAKGGKGDNYGGSGSGGRIAIHYNQAAQAQLLDQPGVRFSAYTSPDPTKKHIITKLKWARFICPTPYSFPLIRLWQCDSIISASGTRD